MRQREVAGRALRGSEHEQIEVELTRCMTGGARGTAELALNAFTRSEQGFGIERGDRLECDRRVDELSRAGRAVDGSRAPQRRATQAPPCERGEPLHCRAHDRNGITLVGTDSVQDEPGRRVVFTYPLWHTPRTRYS